MAEPTGNLLIGKGEQLFENGEWSGSSRKKPPLSRRIRRKEGGAARPAFYISK